ncbi:MAG: hypothetical protein AAF203_02950 [Pseudomonadota bacterium]
MKILTTILVSLIMIVKAQATDCTQSVKDALLADAQALENYAANFSPMLLNSDGGVFKYRRLITYDGLPTGDPSFSEYF